MTAGEVSEQSKHETHGQEPPLAAPGTRIEYCPWEDQESLGLLQALIRTLKESMLSPTAFFKKMPLNAGFLLPLLFAVIVETTGSMAAYLWSMTVGGNVLSEFAGRNAVWFALLIPLLVFLGIFIWGVLLHVSLFLVGGAKEDFEATFRVVCYTSGPELLGIIPVFGGIASLVWKLCITVVGVREVHGISNARAIAALVLPGILCCGLGLVGIVSVNLLTGAP
ncbi:MAG: YIP1 family protein [Desulfomonile tiedjei]|uniref:YIP1 family protein n=1 Tax=Desulfomonile tiedjei TaxID=2358 RepID=A0A9D6V195_9BACT|nr:YIP1 family protein [Desulfomonile tiedjei]